MFISLLNPPKSHPVGFNGQNHIIVKTPLEFLPVKEFEKRQKSIETKTLCLMDSKAINKILKDKKRAKDLKERGKEFFKLKNFAKAANCYSAAILLNTGDKQLWTNRAICRNRMKKYEEAISDCESALSIDSKCIKFRDY